MIDKIIDKIEIIINKMTNIDSPTEAPEAAEVAKGVVAREAVAKEAIENMKKRVVKATRQRNSM